MARNASSNSDWAAITLASGKTLIGKTVDFDENTDVDDTICMEDALELIVETATIQGQIARRFIVLPWNDLVDGSTIDVDTTGGVVVHFQNMGPVDRETYEAFVRQGAEVRKRVREQKSGIRIAQDVPKIKLPS